jgi:hypothetical protein
MRFLHREKSTGENHLSHVLQNELSVFGWSAPAPRVWGRVLLSTLKGIRDKTNYQAAAVMTFSFASTGWRRDWSFRS